MVTKDKPSPEKDQDECGHAEPSRKYIPVDKLLMMHSLLKGTLTPLVSYTGNLETMTAEANSVRTTNILRVINILENELDFDVGRLMSPSEFTSLTT